MKQLESMRTMGKQEFEEARRIMDNLGKAESRRKTGNRERAEERAIMDALKWEEVGEMLDDLERDLLEANAIIEMAAFNLEFAGYKKKDITASLAICADRANNLITDCIYKLYDLQDITGGMTGESCGGGIDEGAYDESPLDALSDETGSLEPKQTPLDIALSNAKKHTLDNKMHKA